MESLNKLAQQTADYWDARGADQGAGLRQWWDLAAVLRYRNELISGDPDLGFEAYIGQRYGAQLASVTAPTVLSLGCGRGAIDRRLAANMPIGSLLGIDVAEQNLELARAAAVGSAATQFRYELADLNLAELGVEKFDAVIAAGILHHLSALEHVLDQVRASLKPNGLLCVDEYIGPDRFQFPSSQRALIRDAFASIPERLRVPYRVAADGRRGALAAALPKSLLRPDVLWAKLRSGKLLDAIGYRLGLVRAVTGSTIPSLARPRFPTAVDVAAGDPSEAVRSSKIMGLLRERFEIVEERGTGLGLLQFLLADIAHHFVDESDLEAQSVLRRLIELERDYTQSGKLGHDFVFVVARRV